MLSAEQQASSFCKQFSLRPPGKAKVENKSLNTIELCWLPYPLVLKQCCILCALYTLSCPEKCSLFTTLFGGGGRGWPLEASKLLQKWISCYSCIFDICFYCWRKGFNNCSRDFFTSIAVLPCERTRDTDKDLQITISWRNSLERVLVVFFRIFVWVLLDDSSSAFCFPLSSRCNDFPRLSQVPVLWGELVILVSGGETQKGNRSGSSQGTCPVDLQRLSFSGVSQRGEQQRVHHIRERIIVKFRAHFLHSTRKRSCVRSYKFFATEKREIRIRIFLPWQHHVLRLLVGDVKNTVQLEGHAHTVPVVHHF